MNTQRFRGRMIALAIVTVLFSACVPSLHPFYTDNDLVSDPRIIGRWENHGDMWIFAPLAGKALQVTLLEGKSEPKKRASFVGRLFKLKDHLFLDLVADNLELARDQSDIAKASLIPGHLLLFVASIEPKLELIWCDREWVDKFLKANPAALAHVRTQGELALTAETPALQTFVLAHLGDGELFGAFADRGDEMFGRVTAAPP